MAEPFTSAPEEVLRYFDAKDTVPTWDWREFTPPEHGLSFTVAKSAGFDILDDIKKATQKAVSEYGSYGEFVDDLEPILTKKGWWGRKIVDGPDGKQLVQLGSLRRLRTIYWANTKTAYAAGEWERIQRTKRGLPYLIYEMSVAERRRPEHVSWVGIILPVDDGFWLSHYPPNGWLCQCRVRQISRREAESLGYDPATPAPQVINRKWTNKQTGEVMNIPRGIDPGWHMNPGANRAANVSTFLGDKLDALTPNARRVAINDLVGSKTFRAMQSGDMPYAGASVRSPSNIENGRIALPVARLSDDLAKLISAKSRTVLFSNADAHKQLAQRLTRSGSSQFSAEDYARVQQMIEKGTLYEDATATRTFIVQMIIEGKPWAAVLRVTQDQREVFLKSFRRISHRHFGESARNIRME